MSDTEKSMTLGELIQRMRTQLVPQGTKQVVKIGGVYLNYELVKEAIDSFEIHSTAYTLDGVPEEANALEKIGLSMLLGAIHYDGYSST